MKNTVTSICVVIMALLLFYGGAGVNLITYCCNDCRAEGVAVLMEDRCCEIHEHQHCSESDTKNDCTDHSHADEEDCCDVERVDFEWNALQIPPMQMQPVVLDLAALMATIYSLIPDPYVQSYDFIEKWDPPVTCPKVYLSLLNTLLI